MRFRLVSDIHGYKDAIITPDKEATLLLPGDVAETSNPKKYREIIEHYCSMFNHVILVAGNHEYFSSSIGKTEKFLLTLDSEIDNFHYLQNSTVFIDGYLFMGSTLWTDFFNSPIVRFDAGMYMNDYRYIRHGPANEPWKHKLKTTDVEFFNYQAKEFFKKCIDTDMKSDNVIKTVVLSHHAPSMQSIASTYIGNKLNGCFVSDMDDFILTMNPDLWVHGHVHNTFDYTIGNTKIMCNPCGYREYDGFENKNFNEQFSFEV